MKKNRMALLLAALLAFCCACALAESAEDMARTETESALTELRESLTGWQLLMAQHAEIGEVAAQDKELTVTVRIPSMAATLPEESDQDAAAWLAAAMAPLTGYTQDNELVLRAEVRTRNGETTLNWRAVPRKAIQNRLGQLETAAVKAMNHREIRTKWEERLLPAVAEMPRRQPDEPPAMALPQADAEAYAGILGWEAGIAAERLAPLFLLSDLSKLSVIDGPESARLTLEVRDWQAALDAAAEDARALLDGMTGVPDLTDAEIETVYLASLRKAAMERWYKKRSDSVKLNANLLTMVTEGPASEPAWSGWVRTYADAYQTGLTDFIAYARTLPYYPRVPQIDSCVLLAPEGSGGSAVSFSLQDEPDENAYLAVFRDGQEYLRLYLHSGDRMSAVLPAGEYTVYITMGPEWFGHEVLFGKDAWYGVFTLTIQDSMRYALSLADRESGNIPSEDLTEEAFREAVPVLIPPEE